MLRATILLFVANLLPMASHAAGNDNHPSNVVKLGSARGVQGSDATRIFSQIANVYAEAGAAEVPPFARAYILRHLGEIMKEPRWAERYNEAFRVGLKPSRVLGGDPDLQGAHEYAVARSSEFDEVIPRAADRSDGYPDRYRAAFVPLKQMFEAAGYKDLPSYAREFGFALVDRWKSVTDIHIQMSAYKLSMEFGRASTETGGLGLDVEHAHVHALEILERRLEDHRTAMEIRARRDVYQKLTDPVEARGFGMEPKAARAEALRLVTKEGVPFAPELVERLEIRRVLARFMARPIRQRGLGYSPDELDTQIEDWINGFSDEGSGLMKLENYIIDYGTAVATYLTKSLAEGNYDEVRAREWALEFMRNGSKYIRSDLRRAGFEPVNFEHMPTAPPKAPGLARRLVNCMSGLLSRR